MYNRLVRRKKTENVVKERIHMKSLKPYLRQLRNRRVRQRYMDQSKYLSVVTQQSILDHWYQNYFLTAVNQFEKGWSDHEDKLRKYLMSYTKFKDWQQVK